MPFPILKIFLRQFRASRNSTPGPSEAEKLIGVGKKISRLPTDKTVFKTDTKKALFQYILGRAMLLKDSVYRRLRRTCIYRNEGPINNLRAESI